MRTNPTLLGLVLTLGACATVSEQPPVPIAVADILRADGSKLGTASVAQRAGKPELSIAVSGLNPGQSHGVHLHTVGKCEGPAFASAGGHLNPSGKQHGAENPAGSHLGDLPNLTIDASGSGRLTRAVSIVRDQLFDLDGTAIVIHADPDDLRTDPSGNSGARIGCGVFLPD